MNIRLVTLNTWKNEGDYQRRLQLICQGLRAIEPDVVLLQECFRCEDTGDDTAAVIAGCLNFKGRSAPARNKEREHAGELRDSWSGLAVLSRFSFSEHWMLRLPTSPAGGERISLVCQLETDGVRFGVGCVHFSHLRDEVEMRQSQIEHTVCSMRKMTQAYPCFLGGDFNCTSSSREVERQPVTFVNALPELGEYAATCPLPASGGALREGRQLDQIWLLKSGEPARDGRAVLKAGGLCLQAMDGASRQYPSDHAGVWADIEI